MKDIIKNFIGKLGYSIQPVSSHSPVDLRNRIEQPLEARYFARKSVFIINVNPEDCIVLWRFNCGKKGNNPLVQFVMDYIESGQTTYSGSILEIFYQEYQPKNVAELFSLEGELHSELTQLPAFGMVFPWEKSSMQSKLNHRERFVKEETKKRGKVLSIEHGSPFHGPISKERGNQQARTLIKLTDSFRGNGYQRRDELDGDILASVLVREKECKYLVKDGYHRVSVLSGLGHENIPVRILPTSIPAFIYRDEAEYWPNVRNGLYTIGQSLKIFDTMFEAKGSY